MTTNGKRVDATRASRALAEKRLEAEEKKFQAGMTTNFFVLQAQRDLNQARNNELQALIDYLKSVVDYETAQVAPLTGGVQRDLGVAGRRLPAAPAAAQQQQLQQQQQQQPAPAVAGGRPAASARFPDRIRAVPKLSVTVITRDEAANLAAALESVAWADEIVVVDSESTDATVEVARRYTSRVIVRRWPGYVAQKNHAAAEASHDWILSLDADERVSPELADEIRG